MNPMQMRFFRLTGALIPLCEDWASAMVACHNRRTRFVRRVRAQSLFGTQDYIDGYLPRPRVKRIPQGWKRVTKSDQRRNRNLPDDLVVPDRAVRKREDRERLKEIEGELRMLAEPEPSDVLQAMGIQIGWLVGGRTLFETHISRHGKHFYCAVPKDCGKWEPIADMIEIRPWEYLKAIDDAKAMPAGENAQQEVH